MCFDTKQYFFFFLSIKSRESGVWKIDAQTSFSLNKLHNKNYNIEVSG